MASILSRLSPIEASRATVSRRLRPVSMRMRVFSVPMNTEFPELEDAKTQNLRIQTPRKLGYRDYL